MSNIKAFTRASVLLTSAAFLGACGDAADTAKSARDELITLHYLGTVTDAISGEKLALIQSPKYLLDNPYGIVPLNSYDVTKAYNDFAARTDCDPDPACVSRRAAIIRAKNALELK
jgi:hypothetical protein